MTTNVVKRANRNNGLRRKHILFKNTLNIIDLAEPNTKLYRIQKRQNRQKIVEQYDNCCKNTPSELLLK